MLSSVNVTIVVVFFLLPEQFQDFREFVSLKLSMLNQGAPFGAGGNSNSSFGDGENWDTGSEVLFLSTREHKASESKSKSKSKRAVGRGETDRWQHIAKVAL